MTVGARRRPWSALTAILAALALLASGPAGATVPDPEVRDAKQHLNQVRERLRARRDLVRELQRRIDRLIARIVEAEDRLLRTERSIAAAEDRIAELIVRRAEIQREIDRRSRHAFMLGPASGLQMVLTADTYTQAQRAIGLLSELSRRDAELAEAIMAVEEEVNVRRAQLERLELRRLGLLVELGNQQVDLEDAFEEQRDILEALRVKRDEAFAALSAIRPFALCPVDGPHSVVDDFGAPRPDTDGKGFRKHQGNDIFAPLDTPIVAPFDGEAVTARNKLGGLAVKVYGEFGHVYNAHLSRYGQLGPVETGDVIGYVGTTGNAQGTSPHNHFQWHPNGGRAVDPHEFLMLVC